MKLPDRRALAAPFVPRIPHLFAVLLLIAGSAGSTGTAEARWPHDPAANRWLGPSAGGVQTFYGAQEAVADGAGGMVVVWEENQGPSGNLRAQRVDATGNLLWGDAGIVVSNATGQQTTPNLFRDRQGNYLVTWVDSRAGNQDIYVQRFNGNGLMAWTANGQVVCAQTGLQETPQVTSDWFDGAWVLWKDNRTDGGDLYFRRVIANGTPIGAVDGIPLCVAANVQRNPVITLLPEVQWFAAAWEDGRNGGSFDIYGQTVDGSGAPIGPVNGKVVCDAPGGQFAPQIVSNALLEVYVTWEDFRDLSFFRAYAHKLGATMDDTWVADGLEVSDMPGQQFKPRLTLDGEGGVVVAFGLEGTAGADIVAQRLSSETGARQWGSAGRMVCDRLGVQATPRVVADGEGGTYVAWYDQRNSNGDYYAQRLDGNGFQRWNSAGVRVGASTSAEYGGNLVSAGPAGCLMAFTRSSPVDVRALAQKVDRWGYLGGEPAIVDVSDVPNDEGGRVKLSWDASPLDPDPLFGIITDYAIYRSAPALGAPAGSPTESGAPAPWLVLESAAGVASYWEHVATQPAAFLPGYSAVVATTSDSVAGSNPYTSYLVQARGWNGGYWFSEADSGYSADDLAPAAPEPFAGTFGGGTAVLAWDANEEPDLAVYRLYRGSTPGFVPSLANRLAELTVTTYTDPAGGLFIYKLTAVDAHGNESPASLAAPGGTVDAPGSAVVAFHLAPVTPNPARAGEASIGFGLPSAGRVLLALYDARGRRRRLLLEEERPAGEHRVRLDGAGLEAGMYFVRLTCDGATVSRPVTLR